MSISVNYLTYPSENWHNCLNRATVFRARLYGRFTEIKCNLTRQKHFSEAVLAMKTMYENQSNSGKRGNPNILKDHFSSEVHAQSFSLHVNSTKLTEHFNETSRFFPVLKLTSHTLPRSRASLKSELTFRSQLLLLWKMWRQIKLKLSSSIVSTDRYFTDKIIRKIN